MPRDQKHVTAAPDHLSMVPIHEATKWGNDRQEHKLDAEK
jgi:hypothetical protein